MSQNNYTRTIYLDNILTESASFTNIDKEREREKEGLGSVTLTYMIQV